MDEYNKVIAGNLNNGSGWWNQYKTQDDINDWIKAALCDHVLQSPSLNIHSLWPELQNHKYKGVWTDVGGTYRRYIDQMGFTITNK